MSELNSWDVAAANNNDAPPDGWPENTMQYSEVNNTAREGMAVIARFWKDINGSLQFAGPADAYTLTLNAGYTAYFQGMAFFAEINTTNTGVVTLNINALGNKSVVTQAGAALSAGTLQGGGVYEFRYDGSVFQLMGGGVADGGITTAKLADEAVTLPKLLHIATDSFLGRDTAATGDVEVLTAAQVRGIINVENNSAADQTAGEIEAIVDHDNLLGFVGAEHIDWESSGGENLDAGRSINGSLALTAGEISQIANIGATVISLADWTALAALVGVNTGDQTITLTGQVEGSGQGSFAASLGTTAISAQSELAGGLVGTDELLVSDAGTLKRMDVSVMDAYFNANLSFAATAHSHTGSTISDLAAADTTTGTFADARIPLLNASKINAGTFTDARIPSLATAKITSGTFIDARITASSVTQHAITLTGGDGITTIGVLNVNRTVQVDSSVIRTTGTQNIFGAKTLDTQLKFSSAGVHLHHKSASDTSGVITIADGGPSGGNNGDIWFEF